MTSAPARPAVKLRADIQALRGLAVLVVVLFHAKVNVWHGGYLGVDIFFVISGFLMTSQIRDGIQGGTFTLHNFYLRRAKRLLPAAYVVFLATTLATPWFLGRLEMHDYVAQLLGAVTFSSNVVLWQQSGYFDGAADLKPLLHTWSLALEEQYYLLLPAAMLLLPVRHWKRFAVATCIVSLVLVQLMANSHVASFYLLPTRAWELMLGSMAALLPLSEGALGRLRSLFWPSVLALILMPTAEVRRGGFDLGALVVCAATFVVIVCHHPVLAGGAAVRVLGRLGDISYSLYLIHWPFMAFLSNAWFGPDDAVAWRLGLVALSVLLAIVLHRAVEKPFQHRAVVNRGQFWAVLALIPVSLVALAWGAQRWSRPTKDYATLLRPNTGLDPSCEYGESFTALPACQSGAAPTVLVWGDSHAMHLVPGLVAELSPGRSVIQATRSTCAPLLGMAASSPTYRPAATQGCLHFNDSVLAYLKRTPTIEVVILASTLGHYVDEGWQTAVRRPDGILDVADASRETSLAGFRATAEAVRALGKKVVVAASPPQQARDMGRCRERLETGLPMWGTADCEIDVSVYHAYRKRVLDLLHDVPAQAKIPVVWMDAYLCGDRVCKTGEDGVALYRDAGHLSFAGSERLFKQAHLGQALVNAAK